VQLIALTGGIASGKSTVAKRLVEHGAVHVDADQLARDVVEPGTPGLAAIEKRFGPSVIAPDGRLNRPALGAIVFSDERSRLDLNAITHPEVWRRGKQLFADAEAQDPEAVIVYDVPLLVESSEDRPMRFDQIVVVQADRDERIRRLVELRGMSTDEAERRVGAQASDEQRLAVADVVIDSNGSLQQTLNQADQLWDRLAGNSAIDELA
jgi:dephospho-CoA kinase